MQILFKKGNNNILGQLGAVTIKLIIIALWIRNLMAVIVRPYPHKVIIMPIITLMLKKKSASILIKVLFHG